MKYFLIALRVAVGATLLIGPSLEYAPHWLSGALMAVLLVSTGVGVIGLWHTNWKGWI